MPPKKRRGTEAPPLAAAMPLRVPVRIFSLLACAWLAWLLARDYQRIVQPCLSGIHDFGRLLLGAPAAFSGGLLGRLLLAAGFWLCAAAVGRFMLAALALAPEGRVESGLFAAGLGAGAMSLLLLLLGMAGLWRPWLLRGLWAAGAVFGLVILARRPGADGDGAEPRRFGAWGVVCAAMMLCAALAVILGGAAPETFYDSLAYHLALPRLYLLHQRIVPTPDNVFSGPPMALEMLYGLMLALDDKGLTALLHGSFGLAAAAALWTLSRRHAPPAVGRLAALIFLLSPMTLYAGTSSGVDLGASFFYALALFAALRSLEPEPADRPEARSPRMGWSVCAGLLAGFAMGTKYSAFSFGASLLLLRFWMGREDGRMRESLAMAAAACLALCPWLLKNLLFFHNPLYPFLCGLRPGSCPADWSGLIANAEGRDLRAAFLTARGLKDYLLFAWTSCEGSVSMDNWPGSALLMLAPWLLLVRWNSRARLAAGLAALGAYLAWSLASRTGRFLLPGLPGLAYAGALALEGAAAPRAVRVCGALAIGAACAAGFLANAHQGMLGGRWDFLGRGAAEAAFLGEDRAGYPAPSYSGFEFINERLPRGAKVLLLGETRSFHLRRDVMAASVFDENPFWRIVRGARDGEAIRAALAAQGVTHLLVNAPGLYNGAPAVALPEAEIRGRAFGEFWSRWLRVVHEDRAGGDRITKWVLVYELLDHPREGNAAPPLNPALMVRQSIEASRREPR